jgi:putative endonuclease
MRGNYCGFVYIITNTQKNVLYTGVTSELRERIHQHKTKYYPNSFSAKYNLTILVYFERFDYIEDAIEREKQIKGGSRKAKEILINSINPTWKDLWDEVQDL